MAAAPTTPKKRPLAEPAADGSPSGTSLPGTVGTAESACDVNRDFVEGREDPAQSKELELQQDA